jgi:ankyrin repeat protein
LIEKGADVNAAAKDGWTALMYAAYVGHADTTSFLIEKEADVNAAAVGGVIVTGEDRCDSHIERRADSNQKNLQSTELINENF